MSGQGDVPTLRHGSRYLPGILLLGVMLSGCVTNCPGRGCTSATRLASLRAAQGGGYFLGSAVGGSPRISAVRPYHTVQPLYDTWIYGIANQIPR